MESTAAQPVMAHRDSNAGKPLVWTRDHILKTPWRYQQLLHIFLNNMLCVICGECGWMQRRR
jgi:hypothetical protein